MLFRYSHIKETFRIHISEALQPGPVRHRCRDRHHMFMALSKLYHTGRKNILIIGLFSSVLRQACLNVKWFGTVEPCRVPLCRFISLPLFRQHMDQNSPFDPPRLAEYIQKLRDIVPVHRSQISNAHIFKKHPGDQKLLDAALGLLQLIGQMDAARDPVQRLLHTALKACVHFIGPKAVQILRHASYIFRNRHMVVIQDDDKILLKPGSIVERFVRHTSGQRTVTDDRDDVFISSKKVSRRHQTDSR